MVLFFCAERVAILVACYACGKQSLTVAPCSGNWAQRSPVWLTLLHERACGRRGPLLRGQVTGRLGVGVNARGTQAAPLSPSTLHCFWVLGHGAGSGKQDRASMLKCTTVPA